MEIGDRMKLYEGMEADRKCLPGLPICIRLDGRAFHSYCSGLKKPYDESFCLLMAKVTQKLVEETNAVIGYTQSDEISLILFKQDATACDRQLFFEGCICKLISITAAIATYWFNIEPLIPGKIGMFDSRVWVVPNLEEAANVFLWREMDATRNSISAAAQSVYSHNQLRCKSTDDMQEMLFQKGINWNDYPSFFKRGTYIKKVIRKTKFSTKEIDRLPPKHAARIDPNLEIKRSVVERVEFPPLIKIKNKVDVLFFGQQPILRIEDEQI